MLPALCPPRFPRILHICETLLTMPFGPTLGVGLGVQTMTFGPTPTQVISEKLLFKVPPLVMCVSHGVQPGSPAYSYCATGMLPEDHELANCSGHSLLLKSAYAAHGPAQEAPYTVCTEGAAATGDFIWHSELLDVASTIDMVDKASLQADGGLPSTDYSSQHVPLVATVTESRSKTKLLRTPLQVRDFNATPAPMMQI